MLEPVVRAALLEDLGRAGDLTTDAIIPADQCSQATLHTREAGIIAGVEAALLAFSLLNPSVEVTVRRPSGTKVTAGEAVLHITGPTRAILTAERTALNFMGRLSGIATCTDSFVQEVQHTKAAIVCTRKNYTGFART